MRFPKACSTCRSWIISLAVAVSAVAIGWGPPAAAVSIYLAVPTIPGQDPTPGFPNAMLAQSLTISPGRFSIVKKIDLASASIAAAVSTAAPLGLSEILLYNVVPPASPDALLFFQHVVARSHTVLGLGLTEEDVFDATTPASIYLEVPGIVGEIATPGHPGVMRVQSISLADNAFSIVKNVDAASIALQLAVAQGTPISAARVLFYDSAPFGPPDETLEFRNVLASSYQVLGGGQTISERVTFDFLVVLPEPSALALVGTGIVGIMFLTRRRFPLPDRHDGQLRG